jgi:heme-binding protein
MRIPRPRPGRAFVLMILLTLGVVFAIAQVIPYRVSNPPVLQEPAWDSPQTRALAKVACFDCHSNETKLLWFERVAPVSWWIKSHVDEGRKRLNFSECTQTGGGSGRGGGGEDDAAETVTRGSMPPGYYTWLGLHAKLTPAQRRQLADGLSATLQGWSCGRGD